MPRCHPTYFALLLVGFAACSSPATRAEADGGPRTPASQRDSHGGRGGIDSVGLRAALDCPPPAQVFDSVAALVGHSTVDTVARGVLADARDVTNMLRYDQRALLGRYVRNGEHGLAPDEHLGFCLIYGDFRSGAPANGNEVAEKLLEFGDVRGAVKARGTAFAYFRAMEDVNASVMGDPFQPRVEASHAGYAAAHRLVTADSARAPELAEAFEEGLRIGRGMLDDVRAYHALLTQGRRVR